MKHILSIRVKVLLVLIPVIAAAMIIMSQQSAKKCTEIVNNQIEQSMHNSLSSIENSVNGRLDVVESTAKNISDLISNSYKTGVTLEAYEDVLSDIIQENDMVLGSGLWFEPKVFDPDEEYVGPYVTKDGDKINVTMEYSNADYDYFNQEYYQNAKNAKKGEALITDPYYDATSGLIMSTCSTPIYDGDKYIGCVTVDMELGQINDFISSIKVGKAGNAMLLSSEGVYIAGVSDEILQNANKITEDKNASLAAAGQSVMNTETGDATYTDDTGTEYKMFYSVIPDTGWHIIAQLPATELTEDVDAMTATQNRILIIALIVSSIAVFLIISYITHTIKQVQKFSDHLANGDLTVKELKNKSHDELGSMAQALNNMFRQNRKMISSIADHSEKMFNSSQGLKDASENLSAKFAEIEASMNKINDATSAASAATEQVNASAEEVNTSMNTLATETNGALATANGIKKRAAEVSEKSRQSSESARALSKQFGEQLAVSIENGKVVDSIGELANLIDGIALQINILSLNASIEAARAGEAGRGFAVVANNIRKLSNETSEAVKNIQDTVEKVQVSFNDLSKNSEGLLSFVNDTVMPDYETLTETAEQYGKDAEYFAGITGKVADMSKDIEQIMGQVGQAIQNIAESSQNTAAESTSVMNSVEDVSDTVKSVSTMSQEQQDIAEDLDNTVKAFKL
ncbi:MAG: methyl-accepting chemotaxis protein [Oribacterium sp.]|nr:methyl-accepting chemotaxis protein [Oribacterium sp.]